MRRHRDATRDELIDLMARAMPDRGTPGPWLIECAGRALDAIERAGGRVVDLKVTDEVDAFGEPS